MFCMVLNTVFLVRMCLLCLFLNELSHRVKSVQTRSFFWSAFFRIRTEYRDLLRKSPYSVRMPGNTNQKIFRTWTLFTLCQGNWLLNLLQFTSFNLIFPKVFGSYDLARSVELKYHSFQSKLNFICIEKIKFDDFVKYLAVFANT